ncbi:YbaN family protein [Herbaspirillum robiniae]|uniref:YbaN family protein n=2 Tax=Herbaspirillum robiniae TaxID=2014887 RepID=A0ABX2LV32_9BURK|nr:YbaN family protein [Herbaspirillum robiniae]NUU01514.1 YbaN family protein [Herbaspirillum robiniae]
MQASPDDHAGAEGASPSQLAPARTRWLWLALAYLSLGVGIVAVFIPGIPTTEFILLSAWAAGKGSPRLQRWLEHHPVFGVMIHNWRNGRVVARRAKISASLMMSLCLVIMLLTVKHRWIIVLAALGMAAGAMWMWSRPERVQDVKAREDVVK